MRRVILHSLVAIVLFSSCNGNDTHQQNIADEARKDSVLTVRRRTGEPIETMVLTERTFHREFAGNGKVIATRSAEFITLMLLSE